MKILEVKNLFKTALPKEPVPPVTRIVFPLNIFASMHLPIVSCNSVVLLMFFNVSYIINYDIMT